MTVTEAAEQLGVHRTTIRKWCRSGALPGALRVLNDAGNAQWRIPRESLGSLQRRPAGAPKGVLRSPVRVLIKQMLAEGRPLPMREIKERLKCSNQLARKYLLELGAKRCPVSGLWGIPSSNN